MEFDPSILDNDELLDRVAAHNEAQNGQGPAGITFLMPQVMRQQEIVGNAHVTVGHARNSRQQLATHTTVGDTHDDGSR